MRMIRDACCNRLSHVKNVKIARTGGMPALAIFTRPVGVKLQDIAIHAVACNFSARSIKKLCPASHEADGDLSDEVSIYGCEKPSSTDCRGRESKITEI